MNSSLSPKILHRIKWLQFQTYIMLMFIFFMICYGFYVSSRSAETTASDLQDIRNTAESAALEASIYSAKASFGNDAYRLSQSIFRQENNINSVLRNIELSYQGKSLRLIPPNFSANALVLADSIIQQNSPEGISPSPLDLAMPPKCLDIPQIKPKRKIEDYHFSGENESSISNYESLRTSKIRLFMAGLNIKSIVDENKDKITAVILQEMSDICAKVTSSPELKNTIASIEKLDDLIELQNKKRPLYNLGAKPTATNVTQDYNFLYLLILNKFGPLIIVFFFSSMLVALYKYNTRMISFYFSRYFAIESLDDRVSASEFDSVARTFSSDLIDFGRMPRTPVDLASDIAAKLVDKIDVPKSIK